MHDTTSFSCMATYDQCLYLLKAVILTYAVANYDADNLFILKESWGRLILWGGAFQEQQLDEILNKSPMLRNAALQSLCGIGDTVTKDIVPVLLLDAPLAKGAKLSTLAETIAISIKKVKRATQDYHQYPPDDIDESENDRDGRDPDHRQPTCSLSAAAYEIGCYVSRLLSLQPAMEALLRFHSARDETASEFMEIQEDKIPSSPLPEENIHSQDDECNMFDVQTTEPEHMVTTLTEEPFHDNSISAVVEAKATEIPKEVTISPPSQPFDSPSDHEIYAAPTQPARLIAPFHRRQSSPSRTLNLRRNRHRYRRTHTSPIASARFGLNIQVPQSRRSISIGERLAGVGRMGGMECFSPVMVRGSP